MSKWSRNPDDVRTELAYALGEGLDPVEYLKSQHHAKGWNGPCGEGDA